ncbi:unnamed protein product, partial [Mesorhabditis belari]|uniref:Transposase n=1 Tax=Mesorhabditis belari TaxID=2138241 RepID=A0AAF3FAM6_9BILA
MGSELLPEGTTVRASLYSEQLDQVGKQITRNHGEVLLLHDNARPHVANLTQQNLKELGWEFDDSIEVENWLRDFFDVQPKNFWEKRIRALSNKWQRIIDNNGDYLE